MTIVADFAGGNARSFGAGPGGIIRFRGDFTLLVDPDGLSMFVVDPEGKIARVAGGGAPTGRSGSTAA
jgi:hypothetical protein